MKNSVMIMFEILSVILGKRKYLSIMLAVAVVVFAVSFYLTVYSVSSKDIFIYARINGSIFTVIYLALGISVSILFGFYASMMAFMADILFKKKLMKEKAGGLTGVGVNIIISGCPTCGVPLLGLLGMPFGLMALPMKGIELKIFSALLLIFSIEMISKRIKEGLVCERRIANAQKN